jgi:hypothetical protein
MSFCRGGCSRLESGNFTRAPASVLRGWSGTFRRRGRRRCGWVAVLGDGYEQVFDDLRVAPVGTNGWFHRAPVGRAGGNAERRRLKAEVAGLYNLVAGSFLFYDGLSQNLFWGDRGFLRPRHSRRG